jgi:hypothetical protein
MQNVGLIRRVGPDKGGLSRLVNDKKTVEIYGKEKRN